MDVVFHMGQKHTLIEERVQGVECGGGSSEVGLYMCSANVVSKRHNQQMQVGVSVNTGP